MQRLYYPSDGDNSITRNRIVPSFEDSLRKPLGRRPSVRCRCRITCSKQNCAREGGKEKFLHLMSIQSAKKCICLLQIFLPKAIFANIFCSAALRFPPGREEVAISFFDACYNSRLLWRHVYSLKGGSLALSFLTCPQGR